MVNETERSQIIAHAGFDGFTRWDDDIYFLERGPCPYLADGLCSVQAVKPFVCRIFPFVPRVIDGEAWLFCVGECDAGNKLSPSFIDAARSLAQQFFATYGIERYARYWNENKTGDFDDSRTVFVVPVFDTPGAQNR